MSKSCPREGINLFFNFLLTTLKDSMALRLNKASELIDDSSRNAYRLLWAGRMGEYRPLPEPTRSQDL